MGHSASTQREHASRRELLSARFRMIQQVRRSRDQIRNQMNGGRDLEQNGESPRDRQESGGAQHMDDGESSLFSLEESEVGTEGMPIFTIYCSRF